MTAQGAGLLDIGASAAAEFGVDTPSLAFGAADRKNWSSEQKVVVTNLTSRWLRLSVDATQGGGAGLSISATPSRLKLRTGRSAAITLRASIRGNPVSAPPAEGTVSIASAAGTQPLRIPWTIPFSQPQAPLVTGLSLSMKAFAPSDTTPSVLSFQAGQVLTSGPAQIRPLARLDLELVTAAGTSLGLLVRMRDVLPGRYTLGLTGRDPQGNVLPKGDYRLLLRAVSPDGSRLTRRTVAFTIR